MRVSTTIAVAAFAVAAHAAALPQGDRPDPMGNADINKQEGGIDPTKRVPPVGTEKTTPEKTTPEKTTPEKTTPEKTTPEKTTPEKTNERERTDRERTDRNQNEENKNEENKNEEKNRNNEGEKNRHHNGGEKDRHNRPTKEYQPEYNPPKGKYEPPKDYQPESEYAKPDYKPETDNYDGGDYGKENKKRPYPANYPKADNYGQRDNGGDDYSYTPERKHGHGYKVDYPKRGDKIKCGEKTKFHWKAPKAKKVKIELVYGHGRDDCRTYKTIVDDCDNTGEYDWDVPTDIPPTGGQYGYGYRVTCKETGDVVYSPQFHFQNDKFYDDYKHPACPTEKPAPIQVPVYEAPEAVEEEQPEAAPAPVEAESPAPAAETPCPPTAEVPVVAVANETTPEVQAFTGAASGLKASFSFVAGLAVLVAFAL